MTATPTPLPPLPAHGQRIFIADLHLDGDDTPRALAFRAMLARLAEEAPQVPTELYILGDLFDFWEEYHRQVAGLYEKELQALEAANRAGVSIVLLSGNRDFLYGKYVRKRFGARLWGDGGELTLRDARRTWIEHGDLLCRADTRYLRYRKIVRSWPVRVYFWLLPWSSARGMIERLKARTRMDKAKKDKKNFEVDQAFARQRLEAHDCKLLMCGHTHRPLSEDIGPGLRLLVLPAWCDVTAGYRERSGSFIPVRFTEDGLCKPATETFEVRPEVAPKKGLRW
ncbi:MAG: UDP-2,3-diacylglucosamine diphosphatase [Planctomycetes bacterium]|nr:UDP-2,3-diacylglucosamine diphosphatase [Planctomycetota bacterium]